MNPRIIPLNLPARARTQTAGNPVTARLESAIANCFPGLEMDHRNFDRRFFPGLVFNFISNTAATHLGALLITVDLDDLSSNQAHLQGTLQKLKDAVAQGKRIFLHSLRQDPGETINLWSEDQQAPLDGLVVWRLIRSLTADSVSIMLAERNDTGTGQLYGEITASRRVYQQKDSTLDPAYSAGELSQSLCSPWQHDFRDCSCNYWASNHPDIVLQADSSETTAEIQNSAGGDRRLLWLRWNQSKPVPPLRTRIDCRPFEMDHYEINRRWQDLPIVLQGREVHVPHAPGLIGQPVPFDSLDNLVRKLEELAGIEHALALEYLYARYTVKSDSLVSAEDRDQANYVAHELLMIATSEMMHLRWVNQILWELLHAGHLGQFTPQLQIATHVPGAGGKLRPVELQPLDRAIDDFIDAEASSATLDGQYARVFATLHHGYPASLAELASHIIADGVSHYNRFREIKAILRHHADPRVVVAARQGGKLSVPKLIRKVSVGNTTDSAFKKVTSLYEQIIENLTQAFRAGHAEDRGQIAAARKAMMDLDTEALRLAAKKTTLGIPFLKIGYKVAGKHKNGPKR